MKKSASTRLPPPLPTAGTGWGHAVRAAVVLMALCGGVYPLLAVSVGGMLFPRQSTGSLIERDGKVVGSTLVGQPFTDPRYFHGRPSAANYDPFAASGSNLAPSNPDLRARAQAASAAIASENGVAADEIPVDLVAASGSGIDPHISPAGARLQIKRVAAARDLAETEIAALVEAHIEPPVFGVLGQPRVNVLELNLALDAIP
jgi:K+-transporting ATPase ATPase C chain